MEWYPLIHVRGFLFVRGAIADSIRYNGEGPSVDEIIKGTYYMDNNGLDETDTSKEMNRFSKALQTPISKTTGQTLPDVDTNMTVKDYVKVFRKTREFTASSPSGIHYGHYIVACKSKELTKVNLVFMVTPFQVGIPLT